MNQLMNQNLDLELGILLQSLLHDATCTLAYAPSFAAITRPGTGYDGSRYGSGSLVVRDATGVGYVSRQTNARYDYGSASVQGYGPTASSTTSYVLASADGLTEAIVLGLLDHRLDLDQQLGHLLAESTEYTTAEENT